jgi:hypothetical protein
MNDITVSRCHATISFKNNNFVLDDNLSKFGTLLLVHKDLEIKPGQVRNLQVGKSVLSCFLSYKEPTLYNRSNYLWQDTDELAKLPQIHKQEKVQEEIKKVYDNILEQQKYLKRQLEAHALIHNNAQNNPAANNNANANGLLQENMHLQRRKLNIEEEEQHVFNSDDEEERVKEVCEYEKLFRQPQPAIIVR